MAEELTRGTKVGEYIVDALVGSGAFGSVYRGVQPVIGKLVAIKVLHRQDPETVSRFVAEARAVNAIRHPHVVDIFAFGQLEDGRHYHVMEWLDGEPLDAYVERRSRVPPEEILSILRPLARALDAAHAASIVHRDLKPSNVFLAQDGEGRLVPKLFDFGIAKLAEEDAPRAHRTGTGRAIGTPHYMSPEQCEGPDIDHRSDIYSFGCVIFRLLGGRTPFESTTAVEQMMSHLRDPPPSLSSVAPGSPTELDAPLLAMLAKAPEDRPPSAMTALDGIEAALHAAGVPTDQLPAPIVQGQAFASPLTTDLLSHARPVDRPHRGRPVLLALGALALVAVIALPFVLGGSSEPDAPPPSATAAPEPPRSATPPPPPPPSRPRTVELRFSGLPEGALVLGPGGSILATMPSVLRLPATETPLELRFEAKGYLPATTVVVPSSSSTTAVQLRKRRPRRPAKAPRKPKKPDRDSVENPY